MSETAAEALARTNFSGWDWAIVAIYLLASLIIGLLVKQFATSMTAYITAGRSVGTWLGVATMTGTELGLITVMYSAEKGFKGGFAAFHIAVLAGVVTFLVGATGLVVVPLRREGVLTIPEFYERRFDRKTRVLGGIMLAGAGILNMGLFLKVGSMFLVGITGLSSEGWALPTIMTALLFLVLAYTVMGGMISVILTDYVQFVLLSFGLVATSLLAIRRLGWDHIFATVAERMGPAGFDPLAEGEFGPSYVLWMAFMGLISCAVWPTAVARALSMESEQAVRRQYMWSSISFTVRFLIPYFWGICAFVFVTTEATELQGLFVSQSEDVAPVMNPLYAMPLFLGRILPIGMIGLLSAAMIAAFMSTHDSYLLCWSSVITQDIVAPLSGGRLSRERRILITRVSIVVIGAFLWWWGLFYKGRDDIWDYMAITGAVYFTGAIALLIGGLYWKRGSSAGAFAALLCGCTAIVGLEPLRVRAESLLRSVLPENVAPAGELLTSARIGLGTVLLTAVVFVLVSLLIPDREASDNNREGAVWHSG